MKKALISPIETRADLDGNEGCRVAFVGDEEFDVAPPLFWIDCSDEVRADKWVYVGGTLKNIEIEIEIDEGIQNFLTII